MKYPDSSNSKYRHIFQDFLDFLEKSTLLQCGIFIIFYILSKNIVKIFNIPLPDSVAGLFILLFIISFKIINPIYIKRGASIFLAHMILLFIPAVVSVVSYPALFSFLGLKVLFIIILSTILVMFVVFCIVSWSLKYYDN